MTTPTAISNKDIERIYRGFEILRSSAGERELPAQLLSTFLWAASHDGCYQSELEAATSMSSSSVSRNLAWLSTKHRLGKPGFDWLRKEKDKRNPKRYRVFLTLNGKQVLRSFLHAMKMPNTIKSHPNPASMEALQEMIAKL
jgi:DNA-binding MarR family transcriptional regulator